MSRVSKRSLFRKFLVISKRLVDVAKSKDGEKFYEDDKLLPNGFITTKDGDRLYENEKHLANDYQVFEDCGKIRNFPKNIIFII